MKLHSLLTVLCLLSTVFCHAATVTGRSAKTALAGTEEIPINDSGTDKKVTVANLLLTPQGAMTATSFNGLTIDTTTGTFDLTNGKTLTVTGSLTLAGTDGTTMTFPGTSQTLVGLTSTQTLTNKTLTSPTLTTPVLGAATATSINGLVIDTTTGTFDLTNGKTLAVTGSLTLAGTDGTTMTFPSTSGTVVTTAATQTLTNKTLTSPTLTTPVLGAATATSVNGLVIDTTTGTFDLTNGKTFAVTHTLTLAGTDGTTMTFPDSSQTLVGLTSTQTLTNKTFTTPVLGAATATSINGLTITSSTGTLTVTNGKTLSASNTLTLAGTDGTTMTFPGASGTVITSSLSTNAVDAANSIWGASNALVLEGATADAHETSITPTDPTADRTITVPNASGTVALSQASTTTALTADDQAVTPGANTVIQLTSDNATATNRTFTLSATGAITGQIYVLIGPASNACEIAATGIQKLSATWSPGATDTLTLLFDGTNFNEIARSNN